MAIVYGTLRAFSLQGNDAVTERDLAKLACVARVAAKRIDVRRQRVRRRNDWSLWPTRQVRF